MENLKKAMIIRNGNVVGAVGDKNFSTLHIGCITPYLGTKDNVPRGYLLADGASYKTTDYPELFNIIGNTYGGDSTNFNVPNLCDGRFLEGSDTSGEYVEAGLPNITGEAWIRVSECSGEGDSIEQTTGAFTRGSSHEYRRGTTTSSNIEPSASLKIDASRSNHIYGNSDTLQPKSLRVLYIIKAFHTNEGVDSKNEVSDPIIEYVEGEIAEVESKVDGLLDNSSTSETSTWSSSKIASQISSKADKQINIKNTDYLKSDRPYLKISRNGNLSHVSYYTCETYILCSHNGDMGALSFIRNDDGVGCVYKNIVGTLPLSVEKYDEYTCWLKYSSTASEIYTVYALNGYKPTVSAVTSTA